MNEMAKYNMYIEAKQFYEYAECGKNNLSYWDETIPYIINMCMASEIYIRLLLIQQGKTTDEVRKVGIKHNLKKLYEELDKNIKNEIYSNFKRPLIYSISKEIENMQTAFNDWRFIFSDAKKELKFLPLFSKELNEVLMKICQNKISIISNIEKANNVQ